MTTADTISTYDDRPLTKATTIAGVRAVVDGTLLEDARVTIEDGVIVEIASGTRIGAGAVDGRGALLLPGLIDTHTDGLERERQPRQTASLDTVFALRSFESRLWSAGITTVFHGVGFDDRPGHHRSLAVATELWEAIMERRSQPSAPVDHRVLYRLEARSEGGFEAMRRCVARDQGDARPLVSYEDHTPGQGQYRDVQRFVDAIADDALPPGVTRQQRVEEIVAAAEATHERAERNRGLVGQLARGAVATVLAHDVEDGDGIAAAAAWGAHIAEFPLTVEAAAAARRLGMPVVCGAPNALRGGSHSGNVAAVELVAAGLCTVLASDYLPTSLLASLWLLAERKVVSLPEAVALVTSGPAAAVGLADRGRLAVGLRADVVLVAHDHPWPRVCAVVTADGWHGPLEERSIA